MDRVNNSSLGFALQLLANVVLEPVRKVWLVLAAVYGVAMVSAASGRYNHRTVTS